LAILQNSQEYLIKILLNLSSASSIQQRVTINSEKIDDVIDINEERIEGLEAVIEHMQSLIRKLHKKVHSLEAKCSKSVEKKCRDHAGNFRNSGDRWENGNCEDCICEVRFSLAFSSEFKCVLRKKYKSLRNQNRVILTQWNINNGNIALFLAVFSRKKIRRKSP